MTHAHPDPRSYGPEIRSNISPTATTSQAARAAYIDSILADWPAPSPQQQRTIGSLLGNGGGGMSVATYQHWEIQQHILHTETPGKFGYFGEVAA